MKRIVKCSYNPNLLDELVNQYSTCGNCSTDQVWDEVYNEYGDESLADDVVEALTYGSRVNASSGLTRSARDCQLDCKDAFKRFKGAIPVWKLQDLYQTYNDVDRQLINMWCRGK